MVSKSPRPAGRVQPVPPGSCHVVGLYKRPIDERGELRRDEFATSYFELPLCRCELGAAERAAYDEARLDHHSDLIVVNTPTIREIITTSPAAAAGAQPAPDLRAPRANRHRRRRDRQTTAITQLGRAHELNIALRQPAPAAGTRSRL